MTTDTRTPIDVGRCTAHSSRTGERCRRKAITGGTVCPMHGASAPQVKAKAAERVAEGVAREMLTRLGVPSPTDPIRALRDLLDEANGNVAALRIRLPDLDAPADPDRPGPDPFFRLYNDERDRLHRVAKDSASIDLDERRLRIDGATARLVMATFEAVLARQELGLEGDQRELFKLLFAEELKKSKERVDVGEVTALIEAGT